MGVGGAFDDSFPAVSGGVVVVGRLQLFYFAFLPFLSSHRFADELLYLQIGLFVLIAVEVMEFSVTPARNNLRPALTFCPAFSSLAPCR